MAKKTAPKKKAAPAKAKVKAAKQAKSAKPVAKPTAVKKKAVAKPVKAKEEKPVRAAKPSLMSKKLKEAETKEKAEVKKASTIVSIIETEPVNEESAKVEKTSKVKPVKVDRGNLADEKAKWAELNKKYGRDKAAAYKMTETYTTLVPLQHKVLGWGFILTNENDRLEVLFETGIRMLISNYKS